MASRETAFSTSYLKQFDVNCLIGQISYKQAADIYNYYNGYELSDSKNRYVAIKHFIEFSFKITISRSITAIVERIKMDRRRLEQAHFRYVALNVARWYREYTMFQFSDDATTLAELTTVYSQVFHDTYSGTIHLHVHRQMLACIKKFA